MPESAALQQTAQPRLMEEVSRQQFPPATLYVTATPIGNAADITLRALHLLSIADAVACEDTRNTAQLLARYGLSRPLLAVHEHNERERAGEIISRLQAGERIALVSDAGTPAVSDPGARLVDAVIAAGLRVIPLPGASAVTTALSACGLLANGFHFNGFLPTKSAQRDTELQRLRSIPATLVLYEAPHRIAETITALARLFEPQRQIVLARELTKLFEEIHRCRIDEAADWLAADKNRSRGEYVLLIEGAVANDNQDEAERVLAILLAECPVSQAANLAAKITGQKKNRLYERALAMKNEGV